MAKERAVVVGAGGISNAWFPPLQKEKVDVVGLVDMNIENARKQIEKYGLDCEPSSALAATLRELQPDFVCDLTIPEAHCEVTTTAMKNGCHVVSEKPMSASMAQGRRMGGSAER